MGFFLVQLMVSAWLEAFVGYRLLGALPSRAYDLFTRLMLVKK
ncbi:hypothetical protein HMPREF3232_00119 [Fannyhessea vaginae]|nr:hypothetical protein HMPREF3232_00119 [Fannyhessea vaginae]